MAPRAFPAKLDAQHTVVDALSQVLYPAELLMGCNEREKWSNKVEQLAGHLEVVGFLINSSKNETYLLNPFQHQYSAQ